MIVKKNQFLSIFFYLISFVLMIFAIFTEAEEALLSVSVTIILIANICYLWDEFQKNILLIMFQLTFFLFLISGVFIQTFNQENYFTMFNSSVIAETMICYWMAASSMWIYIWLHSRIRIKNFSRENITDERQIGTISCSGYQFNGALQKISKWMFYICSVAYAANIADKVVFRFTHTLQAYYAGYVSSLPTLIVKLGDCFLISFMLFLATKPSKKRALFPIVIYVLLSLMTLLYGVRNVFVLNIMFLIIYGTTRNLDNKEKWITRKMVNIGIVFLPVSIILLQAFDAIRRNAGFSIDLLGELFSWDLVKEFFISQSVSSKILPNAIINMDVLGGQPVPYTFGTLYTYLTQNMLVRFFTGQAAYTANSVEGAFQSGNLGSRLAYEMYEETYLTGTGMGGCFVADLYVDFSYIGIIIGTIILMMFINILSKGYFTASPYKDAFMFVGWRWILYTPRDSYFSWAMQAFSFMNIIYVIAVYLLVSEIARRKGYRKFTSLKREY